MYFLHLHIAAEQVVAGDFDSYVTLSHFPQKIGEDFPPALRYEAELEQTLFEPVMT